MLPILLTFFFIIGSTVILIYYYLTYNYNYWRARNLPYPEPNLLFGNTKDISLLRITIGEGLRDIYRIYEGHSCVGIYELRTPVLLLRDPKLIKYILVKDYVHFQGRGIAMNENVDPLCANLINLWGPKWRVLRTKLTPAFTSVKIRNMFDLIAESSQKYKEFVRKYADHEEIVEFRDLTAKFTTDVIATCCFGLETNTIQDEDSEFRAVCRKVLDPSLHIALKRLVRMYMPGIFEWLEMSLNPPDVIEYFMNMVKDMIKYREHGKVFRHDFMQLLVQIKNQKSTNGEEFKEEEEKRGTQERNDFQKDPDIVIDDKVIAAQAYIFFLAGFETSSTTMSFAMYELASNPKIQEKLYQEIEATLKKYGRLSYDAVSEMEYLDRVIRETLRKHPPVGMVPRMCNKPYKIPGTETIIETGTKVLVPIYAIHHDPIYYPEPEVFDPDRFLEENRKTRESCTFLPFGEGPRICIGTRFAYTQTKAGLVALLSSYKVLPSSKMSSPIEYDPTANILTSKSGIWLKMCHRTKRAENLPEDDCDLHSNARLIRTYCA